MQRHSIEINSSLILGRDVGLIDIISSCRRCTSSVLRDQMNHGPWMDKGRRQSLEPLMRLDKIPDHTYLIVQYLRAYRVEGLDSYGDSREDLDSIHGISRSPPLVNFPFSLVFQGSSLGPSQA